MGLGEGGEEGRGGREHCITDVMLAPGNKVWSQQYSLTDEYQIFY